MQPVDLTLTYVYKTKKYLISEKEEITYKNIIKQYKKLILMMLQKKKQKHIIHIGLKFLIIQNIKKWRLWMWKIKFIIWGYRKVFTLGKSKNQNLWLQFIRHKTLHQQCHFMQKMKRNHQILMELIFYPSKSHTWLFYKMFDIAWCDKYDLSLLCIYSLPNLLL